MSDAELTQAIAELQEVVRCRCDEAYRDRGLKDPQCECDSADAVKVVASRIKALTEQLAAARQDAKAAEDELEMQEQEACMMENDYIKLEKERDAIEAKLAKAVEALEALIQLAHDCEKELTEDLHHMDFCGESGPLTNARATLAEIKGGNDAESNL